MRNLYFIGFDIRECWYIEAYLKDRIGWCALRWDFSHIFKVSTVYMSLYVKWPIPPPTNIKIIPFPVFIFKTHTISVSILK